MTGSRRPEALKTIAPELAVAPASFGQRRLWLVDRFSGRNGAYNIPVALRLMAPLDISLPELLLPLLAGAQLVVASREEAANPAALMRLLQQHQVTIMRATPATWRMLVEAGWRPRRGFVAFCGGEALPRDLADALLTRGVAGRHIRAGGDIRDLLGMWRFPDHQVPMLETYWAAITAHVPRPYAGRAALFKARTRKLFSRRQADDLGWSQFIHGPLTVVEVPGSHESVLREPFVQALAAAIRLTVDEAAAPAGVPECDIGWSGSALEASTADGN